MEIRVEKVGGFKFRLPSSQWPRMRTDGIVYANDSLMSSIKNDNSLLQVMNVATLPGIVGPSIGMPDIHWGYGFPIGGVAAFDYDEGIVSPGGVGYDINCGVTLIRSSLTLNDLRPKLKEVVDEIFRLVPSGVGSKGRYSIGHQDLNNILAEGIDWAVNRGYATEDDREKTEEYGRMEGADPAHVSSEARNRGIPQIGTLGAGNHFLEIQVVERVMDPGTARAFGIEEGKVTVMIHTGSRGLGHQVATDYIKRLNESSDSVRDVPDRQLTSAFLKSRIAQEYMGAMRAAANFGFVNRQLIVNSVREAFRRVMHLPAEDLGLDLVYSLAHNIAKVEEHDVDGKKVKVLVHRKGATRAFPAGRKENNRKYRETGHPVLIPGDMGRASYVLVGLPGSLSESFGSSCHGAGRMLSRSKATSTYPASRVISELEQKGIYLRAASKKVVSEEAPYSYKDVDEVVASVAGAGISRIVSRHIPVGVVKG